MYIYVYTCVHMYIDIYVIYIYVCVYVWVYIYLYVYVFLYVYVSLSLSIYMYVCLSFFCPAGVAQASVPLHPKAPLSSSGERSLLETVRVFCSHPACEYRKLVNPTPSFLQVRTFLF